jgi:hypothetical protein
MMSDRTILITGVTGTQGGAVARALRDTGFHARPDAAQAWEDIAENLPGVHGMSASGPGAPRRKKQGKIVLLVARHLPRVTYVLAYGWKAEEVMVKTESSDRTKLNHKQEEIQSWWAS